MDPSHVFLCASNKADLLKKWICGKGSVSTLHGCVPEPATVLMRATTLRWDLTSKQAALTKQNRALCLLVTALSSNRKSKYESPINCHNCVQKADYVLNVEPMDASHIQTHYDDRQTHLWIIIKTHVGSVN